MKETKEVKDIDLVLRKEEIKKFITTVMYYRYGSNEAQKSEFLNNIQAIQIEDGGINIIDNYGDICDRFIRDVNINIPKKSVFELLNEFQIIVSQSGNGFHLQEIWWNE